MRKLPEVYCERARYTGMHGMAQGIPIYTAWLMPSGQRIGLPQGNSGNMHHTERTKVPSMTASRYVQLVCHNPYLLS